MRLVANRQLYIKAHSIKAIEGEEFAVPDDVGRQLLHAGVAHSVLHYETKVITPEARIIAPEVQTLSADPFHHVPLPDAQPPAVAAESDSVLASADVPEPRVTDRGKRAGRKASGSRR